MLGDHALSTQAAPSFEGNAREVERGGDEAKGKKHLLFPPLKTGGCHKGCPKAVKTSHSLLCNPSGGSMWVTDCLRNRYYNYKH